MKAMLRTWGWSALLMLLLLSGCPSEPKGTLKVRLLSDLIAGPEVSSAETLLYEGDLTEPHARIGQLTRTLRLDDSLARSVDVATFESLASGTYTAKIVLRRPNGQVAGQRPVVFTFDKSTTITVHITADCADVSCPNAGGPALSACLAGTCVDPRCSVETPEYCPAQVFCTSDDDCSAGRGICSTAVCADRICIETPNEDGCDPGEYCAHSQGCVSIDTPYMPGNTDYGCGTVCQLPDRPCELGHRVCEAKQDGTTLVTCRELVSRLAGEQCGAEGLCDGHGTCLEPGIDGGMSDGAMPDGSMRDGSVRDGGPRDAAMNTRCESMPCGVGSCAPVGASNYRCTCPSGYGAPSMGGTCSDRNECTLGTDTCTRNQHCNNIAGSFSCHDAESLSISGYITACAVFDGGFVKCWGGGWDGAAGYGDITSFPSPRIDAVDTGGPVTQVIVGGYYTCALLESGLPKCWGSSYSPLGYGDMVQRMEPADETINLGAGRTATMLATGHQHVCAILDDQSVKCWGYNGLRQLGVGDTMDRLAPPDTVVPLEAGAVAIAAREYYTCALLTNGKVQCWGSGAEPTTAFNFGGRSAVAISHECAVLEDGDVHCWNIDGSQPMPQEIVDTGDAVSVVSGYGHSCSVHDDGRVMCWGRPYDGALGRAVGRSAELTQLPNPFEAPLEVSPAINATALSAGSNSTCALLADKSIKCWGVNAYGSLNGEGSVVPIRPVPGPALASPVSVTKLALGAVHSCALLPAGDVYCWGDNRFGQLGTEGLVSVSRPASIPPTAFSAPVSGITAGMQHTCVVMSTGAVKCWGGNSVGQLGLGDIVSRLTAAGSSNVVLTGQAVEVSTSMNHTCAVLSDGDVQCWGDNQKGQLACGDQVDRAAPVTVTGLTLDVTHVATGAAHTCAIVSDGTIRCWGYGGLGSLGYGDTTDRYSAGPAISLPDDAVAISARGSQTCAVTIDGALYCWGAGAVNATTPTLVSFGGEKVQSVSVGVNDVCVVHDDGRAKCWGQNITRQLGTDSDAMLASPPTAAIALGSTATAIYAGGDNGFMHGHTCARLMDGSVKCWGANHEGQLGDNYNLFWSTPSTSVNLHGTP